MIRLSIFFSLQFSFAYPLCDILSIALTIALPVFLLSCYAHKKFLAILDSH